RLMRMPWSVNAFAIEAYHYLLDHKDDYHINKNHLHDEAVGMSQAFRRLGIKCQDTDCNFILCRLPEGNVSQLKAWLMDRYGLLIRDASNFETLDKTYFRVAAQDHESNELLIKCIEEWMSF
ncbi:MAG: threonine-phosphate decarboxylase, partial [Muribaculaceae bacterium]|nr:threonine-phosphate decarboxylase [Muribaculaceae bacterium]